MKEKDFSKEEYSDIYYSSFHGFNLLNKEVRADGWFHGLASDYVKCKADLIKEKPRNCLLNQMSSCYIGAPVRTFQFLNNTVVLVHGPMGCGNGIFLETSFMKPKEVVCTCMNENDAIMGAEKKLKLTLEDTIERFHPEMIGVIGTCTSSIVGDDMTGVCEEVEKKTGVIIIAFDSPGFKHRNWNLGLDESFNMIIDRMKISPEKNPGSINFFNPPVISFHWKEFYEVLPYLLGIGVKINTHAPCFMGFKEFLERYPKAELNVVRCAGTGLQSAEYAEKILGIPYLRVPKPVSIKFTEEFLTKIAEFFGLEEEAQLLIQEEKQKIKGRLERVRSYLKGRRIAITAGPAKNIALAQMAYELGMEVIYLGPIKADSLYHETLEEWIKYTGQDPEIMAEESIYEGEAILSRLRPDIYFGLCEERMPLNRLGIMSLDFLSLSLIRITGFEGTVNVGEYLLSVLENKLLKKWDKYLWHKFSSFSSPEFLRDSDLANKSCQKGQNPFTTSIKKG